MLSVPADRAAAAGAPAGPSMRSREQGNEMRDVDFIFVASNAQRRVASTGLSAWTVTEGIRLNDYSQARRPGMSLRGGSITARIRGSKATGSASAYPTPPEILAALAGCGDIHVHFEGGNRSSLYLSWKEYEEQDSYLGSYAKKAIGFLGDFTGAAFEGHGVKGPRGAEREMRVLSPASAVGNLVGYFVGTKAPVQFVIGNQSLAGGGFGEIKKQRTRISFQQIAGILAGTDFTQERSHDDLDVPGLADVGSDVVGKLFGG